VAPCRTAALTLLVLSAVACGEPATLEPAPVPVTVYRTPAAPPVDAALYSANLEPYTQVELAFQVGGYVEAIVQVSAVGGGAREIQAGDPIAAGQSLAQLQDETYRAQVEQAHQQLAAARANFTKTSEDFSRNERLREKDFVSPSKAVIDFKIGWCWCLPQSPTASWAPSPDSR